MARVEPDTMHVAPFPDRSPKPPTPGFLPRLRPSPYPSRIAPPHLDLQAPGHDHCTTTVPNEIINLVLEMLNDEDLYEDEEEEEDSDEDSDEDEHDDGPASAESRLETLARCCRVSRAFLPKSRQLLYHTIKYNEEFEWNVERLLSCNVPDLAALVRTFVATVATSPHIESLYLGLRTFSNLETLQIRLEADDPGAILSAVTQILLQKPASERPTGFKLDLTIYHGRGLGSDIFESNLEALINALPHLTHLSLSGNLPRLVGPPPSFHLAHLSLTQSNFDLSSLASLTNNSQSTLTTLILSDGRSSATLPSATFHLARHFPLDTLGIFNYNLPPDTLSLLINLPPTLRHLSIPVTPAIVPFLGSAETAISSRGLHIVRWPYHYTYWGKVEWEDTRW
ncbi:hypothetical protein RQP46_004014 [Phenoliferia psychrophenolica]